MCAHQLGWLEWFGVEGGEAGCCCLRASAKARQKAPCSKEYVIAMPMAWLQGTGTGTCEGRCRVRSELGCVDKSGMAEKG